MCHLNCSLLIEVTDGYPFAAIPFIFEFIVKKKRTTFDTGHKETAYSLILISSVKYGCTVPTLHKSGWARGLREQNVNHHLFANPYILL